MKLRPEQRTAALATFSEYFVKNYPGPHTIIGDPTWHAPKIFRAALHAIETECSLEGIQCRRCGAVSQEDLCPRCAPPPVGNLHVAEGCEQFSSAPDGGGEHGG